MSAPVPSNRVFPVGIKLDDGFSTLITIAADTDISFWEKTVQPPGYDGGDAIETTTMHNIRLRTMSPRQLKTLTECQITAQYDPAVFSQVFNIINLETTITIRFPDHSTLAFFGYLQKFEPQENTEGECPMANITIVPTNVDPVANVEADPVLTSVAGT